MALSNLPIRCPDNVTPEEWNSWRRREKRYQKLGFIQQPDLTFGEFMLERDRCKDRSHVSPHFLYRIGFFCNNDRMEDTASAELAGSCAGLSKRAAICTILLHRLLGSPRNEEARQGAVLLGAQDLSQAAAVASPDFRSMVDRCGFSARRTYHAVLNKSEIKCLINSWADELQSVTTAPSIESLRDLIMQQVKNLGARHAEDIARAASAVGACASNTERNLKFHALQIACDLASLDYVAIGDGMTTCPTAVGSAEGLAHVRQFENSASTIESLSAQLGRSAVHIQTALCEFNKYCKWYCGAMMVRPRNDVIADLLKQRRCANAAAKAKQDACERARRRKKKRRHSNAD